MSSLEDFSSVLKENEKINSEIVKVILKELTEKLKKSKEELNEVKRRNLPKIKEIQRKRKEIYEEIERLKGEFNELNSIKPINILEKRRNDFKTESEYISKILNRNIKEEFVNQMKRELKQMAMATDEIESFDQVLCKTIPGCDELNEKFDEKEIEGILVSKKIEKFLTILNICQNEIIRKVYNGEGDEINRKSFELFCHDHICLFFKRRITRTNSNSISNLPQFSAILLNDLKVSIVFCSINFNFNLFKLKMIERNYFETFLKEQKQEISTCISSSASYFSISDFKKEIKRVTLFLSRLEKVLKPLILKSYFKNIQIILLNYSQELIWKKLLEMNEIEEGLIEICKLTTSFGEDCKISHLLKYKPKLICFQKILNFSLIEIINSYHRKEFKDISESELIGIVRSVFASTPLRNEFIKELELGYFDNYEEEEDEEEKEEEYF